MKLGAERFRADLERELRPIYLLCSDEVLLVDEALDTLRQTARARGLAERESHWVDRHFDWEALAASLRSLSLFSSGKLVELRLSKATPGDAGSRAIRALAAREPDGNTVVIVTPNIDRRTADSAWVKAVTAAGAWIDARAPRRTELPGWLRHRLGAAGLECDDEGLALLADRVEGNLLAARQEVDKLALLHAAGTRLDSAVVRAAVADGARYDVFQLGDAALGGDFRRASRILGALREEGVAPQLVLWALVRELVPLVEAGSRASTGMPLAKAMTAAGVFSWRHELVGGALRRQRRGSLRRLLAMAARADRLVKGARPGDPWDALYELAGGLSGARLPSAALA